MNYRLTALAILTLVSCGQGDGDSQASRELRNEFLAPYLQDPSFEVIGILGCYGVGVHVSGVDGRDIFMDVEAVSRERQPQVDDGVEAGRISASTPTAHGYEYIEDEIHWLIRDNDYVDGRRTSDWDEYAFDLVVPYKVIMALPLGGGQAMTLGLTPDGRTVIESWVLGPPNGPDAMQELCFPVEHFSETEFLNEPLAHGLKSVRTAPVPFVHRKVLHDNRYAGAPVDLDVDLVSGAVFLLSRDAHTKATHLRRLDSREGWRETTIETSTRLASLAAAVEVRVLPMGDAGGYLLRVSGVGFGRRTDRESEWVPEGLCFEDLDGDGEFEAQNLLADRDAMHKRYGYVW